MTPGGGQGLQPVGQQCPNETVSRFDAREQALEDDRADQPREFRLINLAPGVEQERVEGGTTVGNDGRQGRVAGFVSGRVRSERGEGGHRGGSRIPARRLWRYSAATTTGSVPGLG